MRRNNVSKSVLLSIFRRRGEAGAYTLPFDGFPEATREILIKAASPSTGAKIVPRYHSSLSLGLSHEKLESAPYLTTRERMHAVWADQVREGDRQIKQALAELGPSPGTVAIPAGPDIPGATANLSQLPLAQAIASLTLMGAG